MNETKDNKPYILAIGDIFSDAFIKLKDDQARVDVQPDGSKRLSMEFGAKLPYDKVDLVHAVGPSPNAAVSFARLGLRAGLMTFLGDDDHGRESLEYLGEQGVDTSSVAVQSGAKSSYWYVLSYGADRTMLVKNEGFDYVWQQPIDAPDWIYLSQISGDAWGLHEDLLAFLEQHEDTKLVFQPGTYHFQWGAKKLAGIYAKTKILIMNREEGAEIVGLTRESVADIATALHALGPEIVVITDGPDGAYASDGQRLLHMPNYPDPSPPKERTGAGDAFASVFVAAIALGEDIETALRWAPINSMNVVQHVGAQAGLLTKDEILKYLDQAPADYKPVVM